MNYDLHSHSNTSDGALSPAGLVERAYQHGVTHLALTDHDTTKGLSQARETADQLGMTLINGIELSALWQNKSIHIVGLGINPDYQPLAEATAYIQRLRLERAATMSAKLEKRNIFGALQAVQDAAGAGTITRSHFADFLLTQGHVNTHQEAFDRYLSRGKPAFVPSVGIDLPITIQWIKESGGVAVLAHPLRYQLTNKWLNGLLTDFKNVGGQAMEVVTGRTNADEIRILATFAQRFQLAGSRGSDFHNPKHIYPELGRLFPIPDHIQPVWQLLLQ